MNAWKMRSMWARMAARSAARSASAAGASVGKSSVKQIRWRMVWSLFHSNGVQRVGASGHAGGPPAAENRRERDHGDGRDVGEWIEARDSVDESGERLRNGERAGEAEQHADGGERETLA